MIAIFPETLALAKAGDVERLAVAARRYFERGAPTPKPSMHALLAKAGMAVGQLPGAARGDGDELAALVAKDHAGTFRIAALLAPDLDPTRERFLLAHLLGHYLLDVLPLIAAGDYASGGYRETSCPLRRYALTDAVGAKSNPEERRERRADAFAAALLMPRGMLRKAYERMHGDVARTAAFFGVSKAALERRLFEIGAQDAAQTKPTSFLEAESLLAGTKTAQEQEPRDAEPLDAPSSGPTMPRSYAASTYGNTERRTGKVVKASDPAAKAAEPYAKRAAAPAAPAPKSAAAGEAPAPTENEKQGMARLREIARRLDKNVPK